MQIDLTKYHLFNLDPDTRFCKQFQLPEGTWFRIGQKSLWYRYKWLDYDIVDLQEYVNFKYGRNIHRNTWTRWINRTEIYLIAERYLKRKSNLVDIEDFGQYKDFIIAELKIKYN